MIALMSLSKTKEFYKLTNRLGTLSSSESRKRNFMKKYYLTNEEFNVLNHIASEAKYDWFYIYDKKDGSIGSKDLETNTHRSLRVMVREMDEGLTDYSDYNLAKEEIKTYENLKRKLKI